MRHAILVLGMHRSGTSALAGALVHLGISPPNTLMPATFENERGYFESFELMVFHDEILTALGSRWDDWRRLPFPYGKPLAAEYRQRAIELLQKEFGQTAMFVMKDPRACRLVPFWLKTLEEAAIEPHIILPFRAPLEVAKSLASRRGMPLPEGIALWLRHALDAERDSRGISRSFITMDDLLLDWRTTLARVGRDLGLTWPTNLADAAGEMDAFLSPTLKHHASDPDGPLIEWASNAFEAFAVLVRNPESALARSTLDAVSAAFDQACWLFGASGRFSALEPPDAHAGAISNDNRPEAQVESTVVSTPEGHLHSLQMRTAELRKRLQALREQTG